MKNGDYISLVDYYQNGGTSYGFDSAIRSPPDVSSSNLDGKQFWPVYCVLTGQTSAVHSLCPATGQ